MKTFFFLFLSVHFPAVFVFFLDLIHCFIFVPEKKKVQLQLCRIVIAMVAENMLLGIVLGRVLVYLFCCLYLFIFFRYPFKDNSIMFLSFISVLLCLFEYLF